MEAVYGFYSTDVFTFFFFFFFAHLIFQNVKHLQKKLYPAGLPPCCRRTCEPAVMGLCVVTHGELSLDCKESFRGKILKTGLALHKKLAT